MTETTRNPEPKVNTTPMKNGNENDPRKCAKCGKPIEGDDETNLMNLLGVLQSHGITSPLSIICNTCADNAAALDKLAQGAARRDYWRAICPPLYQATSLDHPLMPPPAKRTSILTWPFGPKGLLVHGQTRRCKTRLLWLLLRRIIAEGHTVRAVTAHEFAMTCSDAAANGRASEWFRSMTQPDVLFIDDLGKEKLTERVESDLFAVIEHRTSHGRPILTTINAKNGKEMQKKFTPDRGAPIVERLREFCHIVAL